MITMRKSTHGFPLLSRDKYGAPLGGPLGCRSSAMKRSKLIENKKIRQMICYIIKYISTDCEVLQ